MFMGNCNPILESTFSTVPVLDNASYWKEQYHRQVAGQALTKALTNEIRNSSELSVIYQTALRGMADLFGVSQAVILRLRFWDPRQMLKVADRLPKTRVLVESVWSISPSAAPTAPNLAYWISECQVTQAAMKGFPRLLYVPTLDDFETILVAPTVVTDLLNPQKHPALLMLPLENKGKLLGFLALQQDQARQWTAAEIDFIELISGQITSAIVQTETLRQVESLVEDRTAQLRHSVELQGKLYEVNRKQIERLLEMNKRMDEFLSTLSHELRTPLTSMMLAIRMLRELTPSPEQQSQYLTILEQQCVQETNLINDLLALQELETEQVVMPMQVVDLPRLTQELKLSFEQRWAGKGLLLDIESVPEIRLSTDTESLNRVLLELLTNAGKYGNANTQITMTFKKIGKQLEIAISNFGSGITAAEMPYIFEKFRRGHGITDSMVAGTGLGLALVKSLVQHLRGTIMAESTIVTEKKTDDDPLYMTTFTVLLPLSPDPFIHYLC